MNTSKNNKMFQEERIPNIVKYIKEKGRATVEELSEYFKVSPVTIRRDLIYIEQHYGIKRTHGGAINYISENNEFKFDIKYEQNKDLKIRIANEAIKYIEDGSIIAFDGGSTNFYICKELNKFSHLKIITNSIPITYQLKNSNYDIIIAGGNVRKKSLSVVGPLVNQFIENFNIDVCFIGTTGIDNEGNLYSPNELEAATKKVFMKSSQFKILVADSTKINTHSFARFGSLKDFNIFITTKEINEDSLIKLKKINPKIILV